MVQKEAPEAREERLKGFCCIKGVMVVKRTATLVSVTWMDACCHHGTFSPGEVAEVKDMVCHTAGYLLPSSKGCIKIGQELMDKVDGRCREVHVIRRVDVKKIIRHKVELNDNP